MVDSTEPRVNEAVLKPDVVRFFTGAYSCLSNFEWEADGLTTEHRFQAAKTHDGVEKAWVLASLTPGTAKRRGRQVALRPDWEEVKEEIMFDLLRQKFRDNPDFAAILLATGDAYLEEGNSWGDFYWGVCNGQGQNRLGQLLMQVRQEISNNAS